MLNYGLYARKSDDDRRITEKSTGEQVAECRAIAAANGLRIEWVSEESKSAMKPRQRPRYTQLIQLVRKGSINAVLCWHVNRLVRNMEEGGELVQLVIDGQIKEIRTPHATYRTGESIWPVVIEAASATQHSIDQSRTVKRSMEGNFRQGGCNHKALPGYRNIRNPLNTKRGLVEPDEHRFLLIRKAWDLLLTEIATQRDIVRALEEWGYRVKATPNLPERSCTYNMVYKMFRNPFFAGYVQYNGQLVKGRHVPMVTADEFDRVQRILNRRSFKIKRRHSHAFAGLMRCGHCGQQVTGEWKRLANGTMWETYHCSDSFGRCTTKGLAASKVLIQLSETLAAVRVDPVALDLAAADVRKAVSSRQEALVARLAEQRRVAAAIDAQRSRLEEMWLTGMLTDSERYKEMEEKLIAKQQQATLALGVSEDTVETTLANLTRTVEYLKSGCKRFEGAPPERQSQIIQTLGTFIFFGHEKKIELRLRPVLKELVAFVKEEADSLELTKISSYSQNEASFEKQFCFGGTNIERLELPDSLLKALEEDQMPSPSRGILDDIPAHTEEKADAQHVLDLPTDTLASGLQALVA